MSAYIVHTESISGSYPVEKPERSEPAREAERECCINFPRTSASMTDGKEPVLQENAVAVSPPEEPCGAAPQAIVPDCVPGSPDQCSHENRGEKNEQTCSTPGVPVSISLETYREEGIARFFANGHQTYHPAGSGRASEDFGRSLITGARRPKTAPRPSAAFRDALTKKRGDSNLGGFKHPSRKAACPEKGVAFPNAPSPGAPFPDELLSSDPGHSDQILATAFEKSACGLTRKERESLRGGKPVRAPVKPAAHTSSPCFPPTKRLRARASDSPVDTAVLPIIRIVDGDLDLSDPPAVRTKTPDWSGADPNLLCLIDVWPTLPRRVRDAVMAVVRAG